MYLSWISCDLLTYLTGKEIFLNFHNGLLRFPPTIAGPSTHQGQFAGTGWLVTLKAIMESFSSPRLKFYISTTIYLWVNELGSHKLGGAHFSNTLNQIKDWWYTLVNICLHTARSKQNNWAILTTFTKKFRNKWYLIWKP